jgi:uncharacterized protein
MLTPNVVEIKSQYVTKERYKVDLSLQMAVCEANYLRINKLLRVNKLMMNMEQDYYRFLVTRGSLQWLHQLRVIERSRYTTTIELTRTSLSIASEWLSIPKLTLRVYHDADLAEVLAWEGHRRLRPRYDYPNRAMYQSDEKYQLNSFLGEWLDVCLNDGHSVDFHFSHDIR